MTFEPTVSGLLMKSSVNSGPHSTMTPPSSWPSVNGQGSGFGQWPLRMCKSVPQTPQAPILISAAFLPTFGHGTLRITGFAPGPSWVQTRICCMRLSSRAVRLVEFFLGRATLSEAGDEANCADRPPLTLLDYRLTLAGEAINGERSVAQSLGRSRRAVPRSPHHGVSVSKRRSGRAAVVRQIRRQSCRYRAPDRTLFHAGRCAVATRRRNRTKIRRQAHGTDRAGHDARRQPCDGAYRALELADRRTACRRRRRRAVERATDQDDHRLVRRKGDGNRDGDLRQFLAGRCRIVVAVATPDRHGLRPGGGAPFCRRADRGRRGDGGILPGAGTRDCRRRLVGAVVGSGHDGGDRGRADLGPVQSRLCDDLLFWADHAGRTRLYHCAVGLRDINRAVARSVFRTPRRIRRRPVEAAAIRVGRGLAVVRAADAVARA